MSEYREKFFEHKQDIPSGLRQALENKREISYGEYGDKKIVKVPYGGKTYAFYRDFGRESSEWVMDIYDEKGKLVKSADVNERGDIEFLEKLFQQDIPRGLRQALENEREVHDEAGEKVVTVRHGNKTYKFRRDFGREYADWAMDVIDEKEEFVGSIDIREVADVEFLDALFGTIEEA